MILLTSANSKTQRHVLPALIKAEKRVRAFGRTLDEQWLSQHGVSDLIRGDLLDRNTLKLAMTEVETVVHLGPPLQAKESTIGQFVIDAAVDAGVQRFIYLSVISPQISSLMNHQSKLEVEEYLASSRLDYTILQPQHYFQNVRVNDAVMDQAFGLPYSMDRPLAFVDMLDLAEAVRVVACTPGHSYATYQISSSEHLTGNQIAEELSRVSGKTIKAFRVPLHEVINQLTARLASEPSSQDWTAEAISRLFTYYDRYGIRGNGNVLTWLIKRPPTTFEEFVRRELAQFKANSGR